MNKKLLLFILFQIGYTSGLSGINSNNEWISLFAIITVTICNICIIWSLIDGEKEDKGKVFKLKALITASDRFADHRTTEYYLNKDYKTYEEANQAIPFKLKELEKEWNPDKYSNYPDGFYLTIHEFVKSNFSTTKYT